MSVGVAALRDRFLRFGAGLRGAAPIPIVRVIFQTESSVTRIFYVRRDARLNFLSPQPPT